VSSPPEVRLAHGLESAEGSSTVPIKAPSVREPIVPISVFNGYFLVFNFTSSPVTSTHSVPSNQLMINRYKTGELIIC